MVSITNFLFEIYNIHPDPHIIYRLYGDQPPRGPAYVAQAKDILQGQRPGALLGVKGPTRIIRGEEIRPGYSPTGQEVIAQQRAMTGGKGFLEAPNIKQPITLPYTDPKTGQRINVTAPVEQHIKASEERLNALKAKGRVVGGAKRVVGQQAAERPGVPPVRKAAAAATRTEPTVTPPKPKTGALEDLTAGAKKIGTGLGKAAEGAAETAGKGVSALGKGISAIGQYAQENPGAAAGIAGGAALAAWLGRRIFGKPVPR